MVEWTKENTELLVRFYKSHTAREIASMLGTTKNSVIGKANRLGIKKPPPGKRKFTIPCVEKSDRVEEKPKKARKRNVTLMEVRGCRHETSNGRYCNAEIEQNKWGSWCKAHRPIHVRDAPKRGADQGYHPGENYRKT